MTLLWLPLAGVIWLLIVGVLQRRWAAQPGRTAWWRDVLAGGLLFVLTLGFFWRMLAGDVFQPADGGDLVSFLFPTYRFAAGELAQGRLPLWNPTLYSGAPFIGDIQAGFLYLPNLLLFLASPRFAYPALQWLAAAHIYWAGLGMYLLLRTLRWEEWSADGGMGRVAACFGAVAFMFSNPLLTHFGNLNLIAVLSWLPWVLAAYARAWHKASPGWAAAAGLLLAVSTYAGHAQSTAYIGMALVLYTAGETVLLGSSRDGGRPRWRPAVGRAALLLATTVGLGLLLAAPILLPAVELTRQTVRSAFTYQDAIAYSLAPTQGLIGLLTPGFFGQGPALHWSLWQRVELPYAGVAALLLACYAIVAATPGARRQLWVWLGMAVFGFLLALGVYGIVHGWLTVLLPVFDQFRAPARALVLWVLGLSVLAALGVDGAVRTLTPTGHSAGAGPDPDAAYASLAPLLKYGALILAGVAVPLSYLALLITQGDQTAFLRASLAALAVVLAAAFWLATWALLAGRRSRRLSAGALGLLLVALIFVDLSSTQAYNDISPTDPTAGFAHPAIIDFLKADPDVFRIDTRTAIADRWQPDTAALAGLEDVGGVANPLTLRSFEQFWQSTGGRDTRRYDLLNVKYVIVKEGAPLPAGKFERVLGPVDGLEVYRNRAFLPRAWFAAAGADLNGLEPPPEAGGVQVQRQGPGALALTVNAPAEGYVIVSELWYPGWQATVNGAPAAVQPVDGAFLAIPVPAGASTVALQFAPPTFQWGLLAGAAGLVLLVAVVFWSRRRR